MFILLALVPQEICELVDLLKNHRSWKKRIFNPFIWYFVALIAFNIEIFGFLKESVRSSTPLWVHFVLIILTASWPLAYAYSRTLVPVKLTRRHDGGFWTRNREAVILLMMGAVLGGIVTYIVTILTK